MRVQFFERWFAVAPDGGSGRPGEPYREIPIEVPETPAEFDARKRAAERPDPPEPGDGDAQIDHGDDRGGSRT